MDGMLSKGAEMVESKPRVEDDEDPIDDVVVIMLDVKLARQEVVLFVPVGPWVGVEEFGLGINVIDVKLDVEFAR